MSSNKRMYCVSIPDGDAGRIRSLVNAVSKADARKWFVANFLDISRADVDALADMLAHADGPVRVADSSERPDEGQGELFGGAGAEEQEGA